MRHRLILFVVFGWLATATAGAESTFQQEAFSEDDFAQFFSLIVDGKISKEKMSARGSGHATVALPLHSGDEISTWSEARGANQKRLLEHVTFTAYKVVHLESYVEEIDMDAWTRDVVMLKKSNR